MLIVNSRVRDTTCRISAAGCSLDHLGRIRRVLASFQNLTIKFLGGQLFRDPRSQGTWLHLQVSPARASFEPGNTVHFTLDNVGNVIKQEVRGAGGELVAPSKRTYDALNRLQKEQRDDPGLR